MKAEKFTADNYKKISNLINSTQSHVLLEIKKVFVYTNIDISNRVAQVLAMQITEPILRKINLIFLQKKVENKKIFKVNSYDINLTDGRIKASYLLIFNSALKFLFLWSYVFFLFFISFIKRNRETGKVTLIHGVPASEISTKFKISQFEKFCSNGPIKILNESKNLIIQSNVDILREKNSKFIYTRYPLFKVIDYKLISLNEFKGFLIAHCKVFFSFYKLIFTSPISCILWRDFGLHSLAEFLNNTNLLQSNVITNTNWLNQFLWMTSLQNRQFKTHMILYSLNSSPLRFKGYPALSPHPSIKYLRADYIYVWHKSYVRVLQEENINIEPVIVPPIVWYMPQIYSKKKSNLTFNLCIFDLTPMNQKGLKFRGMIENYYNFKNMKRFIDDILYVANQISLSYNQPEIIITLKHKRARHENFDSKYLDYVKNLSLTHKNFSIADTHFNLFNLISRHDAAIVVPFSSPVFIADYLKVPSFFYDSTGDLIYDKYNFPKSVKFCNNRRDLKLILEELIRGN